MTYAKIEIRTRDIENTEWLNKLHSGLAPQHLFIIHTDSKGKEIILRGGPETVKAAGMFMDDIKITKQDYVKRGPDWVLDAPSIEIARGTDVEMQALVDKMWAHLQTTPTTSIA